MNLGTRRKPHHALDVGAVIPLQQLGKQRGEEKNGAEYGERINLFIRNDQENNLYIINNKRWMFVRPAAVLGYFHCPA
jgi:hypothetical protein